MANENELDSITASAIAEETGGAPVAAPIAAPVEPPVESVQSEADPFVGEFLEPDYAEVLSERDRGLDEEPVVERPLDPVVEPAPVAAVETPSTPAAPVTAPQSVTEVPQVAQPVVPAVAATTPGPELTPEQQAAAVQQLQKDVMVELSKLYQFAPEDAAKIDDLEKRPSEYLPELLAKAHQNAYAHAYQAIMTALPTMVNQVSQVNVKQTQAENAFLTRWPELRGQDDVAVRAIQTYRQMNPKATLEETIERGGMLAMVSLGRTPGAPAAAAPTGPAPLAPPRPIQPGGGGGPLNAGPRTYEEGVYDEILREEKNFGRG